jgi:hypothetical protein
MNLDPNLVGDAFKTSEIMNYPYATGN